MANDWIIDVLADLRTYATTNGFSALADQLEDATLIAVAEIASKNGGAPETAGWDIGGTGPLDRKAALRQGA